MNYEVFDEIDYNTLISGWFIPENVCDDLINYFNSNKGLQKPGMTGGTVKKEFKDSTDISIAFEDFDKPIINEYNQHVVNLLKLYQEKYPETKKIKNVGLVSGYNLQYYKQNGGFKNWHSENYHNENNEFRVLVFMTYLNNALNAGTEFKHQKILTPAKKGLTLIWPAYFTHEHRGQISQVSEKYIATGWLVKEEKYLINQLEFKPGVNEKVVNGVKVTTVNMD